MRTLVGLNRESFKGAGSICIEKCMGGPKHGLTRQEVAKERWSPHQFYCFARMIIHDEGMITYFRKQKLCGFYFH